MSGGMLPLGGFSQTPHPASPRPLAGTPPGSAQDNSPAALLPPHLLTHRRPDAESLAATAAKGARGTMIDYGTLACASRRWLAIGALALLAGCGTPVNPFTTGSSVSAVDRVFLAAAGTWDRNKDGIVTCDEWKAYAAELFDAADTNHDGMLDPTEFATLSNTDKMFVTADFDYFDANRDGKVSRAELIDRENPAFRLLDHEKKCALTTTELTGGRTFMENAKPMITPPTGPQDEKNTR